MAQILRCSTFISPEVDWTNKRAVECGSMALACVECGASAGCIAHALFCRYCGRAVCDSRAYDHGCQAGAQEGDRGINDR